MAHYQDAAWIEVCWRTRRGGLAEIYCQNGATRIGDCLVFCYVEAGTRGREEFIDGELWNLRRCE